MTAPAILTVTAVADALADLHAREGDNPNWDPHLICGTDNLQYAQLCLLGFADGTLSVYHDPTITDGSWQVSAEPPGAAKRAHQAAEQGALVEAVKDALLKDAGFLRTLLNVIRAELEAEMSGCDPGEDDDALD